jgi:hypothetical protein
MRVACHACLDRLRFGSCPCQVLASLRLVFVSARPCLAVYEGLFTLLQISVRFCEILELGVIVVQLVWLRHQFSESRSCEVSQTQRTAHSSAKSHTNSPDAYITYGFVIALGDFFELWLVLDRSPDSVSLRSQTLCEQHEEVQRLDSRSIPARAPLS